MLGLLTILIGAISLPLVVPPPPKTQDVYVVVSAVSNMAVLPAVNPVVSKLTPEFRFTITNNEALSLNWDAKPGVDSTYLIWWSTNSGLTNGWRFSTNAWPPFTFFVLPPPPPVTNYRYYYAMSSTNISGVFHDSTATPFLRQTNAGSFPQEWYKVRVNTTTNALP